MHYSSILLLIYTIVAFSCKNQNAPQHEDDRVVASVGSRILFISDLEQIIHPNTNSHDSTSIATAYIDQWVRDQLMTREAARYFSSDFEIEKLVDDYREKLLKYNLEERIIEMRFDTSISDEELQTFYAEMKAQFLLNQDIYRCIYARFSRNTIALDKLKKYWNEDNDAEFMTFASAYGEQSSLDTLKWMSLENIKVWTENWSENRIVNERKQRQLDEQYEYFLKIVEKKDKGATSPLSYIKPQLVKMLLHKRKQGILEKYKQELYKSAINNNLIKIPQ